VLIEAETEGITRALDRRDVDDLAALAAAARLLGAHEIAQRSLLAQRRRFPGTTGAHDAAFHLGRLLEEIDPDGMGAVA
jgi:hypothetical protein